MPLLYFWSVTAALDLVTWSKPLSFIFKTLLFGTLLQS